MSAVETPGAAGREAGSTAGEPHRADDTLSPAARAGLAIGAWPVQVLLWVLFANLFLSLLAVRNEFQVDYHGFLDAGRRFWLRDPGDPLYQAGNGYYNPAWVAVLLSPLGALPDRLLAYHLGRLAQVLVIFTAAWLWLGSLPLPQRLLWSALSIMYLPAWQSVEYGQVLGLMLLGYSLLRRGAVDGRLVHIAAGAALLTAKPSLAAVPLLALLAWSLRTAPVPHRSQPPGTACEGGLSSPQTLVRRLRHPAAALVAGPAALLLAPMLWQPGWPLDWLASITASPPGLFREPTNVFQLVSATLGPVPGLLALAVAVLGAVVLGAGRLSFGMPAGAGLAFLAVLGLLASPQVAFVYDLTLLLPALWALLERPSGRGLALFLYLLPIGFPLLPGGKAWAIFYSALAGCCLFLTRASRFRPAPHDFLTGPRARWTDRA